MSTARCGRCSSLEHATAECRKPFMRPMCKNCGSFKHVEDAQTRCPQRLGTVSEATIAPVFCYHCERPGHFKSKCPQKDEPKCFECNMVGHRAADCAMRQARLDAERICYRCNAKGHVSARCPQRGQQSLRVLKLPASRDDDNQSVSTVASATEIPPPPRSDRAWMQRVKAKQAKAAKNAPACS